MRGFRGNREVDSLIGDCGVGHLVLSKSEFGSVFLFGIGNLVGILRVLNLFLQGILFC